MALPVVGASAAITGVGTFLSSTTAMRSAVLGLNGALRAGGAASSAASAGFGSMGGSAEEGARGLNILGTAAGVATFGLTGLLTAITSVVTSLAIAGVKIASDFQTNIGKVGAVTSSTTEQLHELRAEVVRISLATGVSLGDVSDAAFELAKGGVELKTQLDGALESVVNLSIASGGELGLARAAMAVATGIAAFKLETTDAVVVADALTNAAQRSTASFTDMAVGFSYIASTAAAMNLTIDETAAMLGVLAQAGLRGSTAGTNLRQALVALLDPSKEGAKAMREYGISVKDAEGNIRPARDILLNLEEAFGDAAVASGKLTEAERLRAVNQIFTTRGANAVLALVQQTTAEFDKFLDVTQKLTAADVAKRMLLPLAAQFGILTNAVKIAANAFGEGFIPLLSEATRGAIGFIGDGQRMTRALTAISLAISDIIAGRGLGEAFELWGRAGVEAGSSMERAIRSVIDIMLTIRNVVTQGIIPALQELGGAITGIKPGDDIAESWAAVGEAVANIILVMGKVTTAVIGYIAYIIDSFKAWVEAGNILREIIVDLLGTIAKAFGAVASIIVDVVGGIIEILGSWAEAIGTLGQYIPQVLDAIIPGFAILRRAVAFAAQGILAALAAIADGIAELVPASASAVQGWAHNLNAMSIVTGVLSRTILGDIARLMSGIGSALAAAADADIPVLSGIAHGFNTAANAARAFAGGVAAAVAPAVTSAVDRAGSRIRAMTSEVGDAFSEFGERTNASVEQIGSRFGDIIARVGRLKDIIASIQLGDSFKFGERGFNLDNLIQGMDRLQDEARGTREEAERTAPAFDDMGDKAGKAAKGVNKLADAFDDVALEIQKLETDFAELERNAADKIEEIGLKFTQRMVEANEDWAESTREATQKASDAIDELNQNLRDNRAMRERRDNFERELEQEAQAWRRHWENIEFEEKLVQDRMQRARQRMLDDIQTRIDKQNDEAARKRDEQLEDERQRRSDALEDERDARGKAQQRILDEFKKRQEAEADALKESGADSEAINRLKLEREAQFTKLKEEIDEKEKLKRRAEEREERDRRRAEEEAERRLREQMADGERKRNRALEDEEAKISEARDRASLALRRNMEEIEREFKARQDGRRRQEEDRIEDERVTKRINEINSERDKRIQEINLVLKKKQEKIQQDADEEVRKYKKALDERMADLRDALLDKSLKLVQEHGEAIQPAIDELFYVFDTRAERTIGLYQTLIDQLNAITRMQGQLDTPEPQGFRQQPVPLLGMTQPFRFGLGPNMSTVNYNVNANYSNVQSPASVREDMQALVMLSMR